MTIVGVLLLLLGVYVAFGGMVVVGLVVAGLGWAMLMNR
jgi:hypothetical protein